MCRLERCFVLDLSLVRCCPGVKPPKIETPQAQNLRERLSRKVRPVRGGLHFQAVEKRKKDKAPMPLPGTLAKLRVLEVFLELLYYLFFAIRLDYTVFPVFPSLQWHLRSLIESVPRPPPSVQPAPVVPEPAPAPKPAPPTAPKPGGWTENSLSSKGTKR